MNFRILKRDLKRKKSINIILLVFVILASVFVSISISNLKVVVNGIDNFLRVSELPDYLIISTGGVNEEESLNYKNSIDFFEGNENVERYEIDEGLWSTRSNYELENGENIFSENTITLCSFDIKQQKFFDADNKAIEGMEDGSIYICKKVWDKNDLKVGESIYIVSENGYRKEFKLAGYMKDAFLGSEFMGNARFIVSSSDYEDLKKNAGMSFPTKLFSIWTSDLTGFVNDFNKTDINVAFQGDKELINYTYFFDTVMAMVLLLVSICLIIVSALMLRFTIIFTINEDYKEIGIMKAIGIKDSSVRKLYMSKYVLLSAAGSFAGFIISLFLSDLVVRKVTESIVVENNKNNILIQFIACVVLVLTVVGAAYLSTGKIKQFTPMDAIRSGSNGERFSKKGIFKLSVFGKRTTTFMALNDVISEWKKYILLLLVNIVGVWLVIMPVNSINTINSDKIISWFSMQECDFFITDDANITSLISQADKAVLENYLDDIKNTFEDNGVEIESIFTEAIFRFNVRFGENSYNSMSYQGLGSEICDYSYIKGIAPKYDNEVAITHVVAKNIGADVGDTVYITNGSKEEPYVVTAIFQTIANMGEGIRFTENTKLDYSALNGAFGVQVKLVNKEDMADCERLEDIIQGSFPNAEVSSTKEYIENMIGGISDSLGSFKYLMLVIVMIINVLVIVLMQKMFLIREKGEMVMLKAIGFSNRSIIGWQTKRIAFVLLFGIMLGTVTGVPFSQVTAGEAFKVMGASRIEFVVNPLEVYCIYPVILFVTTVIACVITMLKVKIISVKDINDLN